MSIFLPEGFRTTVTVTRATVGSYVDHKWVAGSTSTFDIEASVQPVTGEDLLNLPEAQRVREPVEVICSEILQSMDEENKIPADKITANGSTYEIQKNSSFEMGQLDHGEYIALRVNP